MAEREAMKAKRRLVVLAGVLAAGLGVVPLAISTPADAASTVNLAITGSVQCEHGLPVEGVWVASSLGGSGWAGRLKGHDATVNYFRYPPARGMFSTTAGSKITLDVGCGPSSAPWSSNNASSAILAPSSGNLVLNAFNCVASSALVSGKTVAGTCALPPTGINGQASPNPFNTIVSGNEDCTCGAAYMWMENGSDHTYPRWSVNANAGVWATKAAPYGWKVLTYPAQHAVLVEPTNPGHVGWVTSINVLTGVVTYIDMNGASTCGPNGNSSCSYLFRSRTISLTSLDASGDQFILRQPGYEWSWGSAAYPATPADCLASY